MEGLPPKTFAESEVTGQGYPLVFCMEKAHGKYRITGVDNLKQIVEQRKRDEEFLRKNAALADEAKAKAKPLVDIRLQRIMLNDDTSQCTLSVTNKGTAPIEGRGNAWLLFQENRHQAPL